MRESTPNCIKWGKRSLKYDPVFYLFIVYFIVKIAYREDRIHFRFISSAGRKRLEWTTSKWSVDSRNIDLNFFDCILPDFYRSIHYTYNFNANLTLQECQVLFLLLTFFSTLSMLYHLLMLGPVFLCLYLTPVYPSSRNIRSTVSRWHLDFGALSFLFLYLFPPSSLSLFHSRVAFCLSASDQTLL